jgi:hypothetical protein
MKIVLFSENLRSNKTSKYSEKNLLIISSDIVSSVSGGAGEGDKASVTHTFSGKNLHYKRMKYVSY